VTFDGVADDAMRAAAKRVVLGALSSGDTLVSDGVNDHTQVQQQNGVPFVRLTPVIERPRGSDSHPRVALVEYVIWARGGVYDVAFTADAVHEGDVAKVADNAMANFVASPPVRRDRNPFNAFFYRVGRLGGIGLVALMALLRVIRMRARART
jgi:hypothetical protein